MILGGMVGGHIVPIIPHIIPTTITITHIIIGDGTVVVIMDGEITIPITDRVILLVKPNHVQIGTQD